MINTHIKITSIIIHYYTHFVIQNKVKLKHKHLRTHRVASALDGLPVQSR